MITPFSLSRREDIVLPTRINADGGTFLINADFRNILRILRMVDDENVLEVQKPLLLESWFFPEGAPKRAVGYFREFMGEADEPKEAQFDFEFDAEEIYASFLMQYGIDLFSVPFLHWRKFLTLLRGLTEQTPFVRKLRLRFSDLKGYSGAELAEAAKAKEAVQLPERLSRKEQLERAAFEAEWG